MRRLGVLLPIIAGACWGGAGVFIRILAAAGFDNVTITSARTIPALFILVLVTFIYDRSLFKLNPGDLPRLAAIGLIGFALMNILYNVAVNQLSMSLASILLCTAPVYVIIMGTVLFKEKLTKTRVICMLGALLGCFLLSGILETGGLKWSLYGIAMGVASAICNAIYTIEINEMTDVRKCHPLTIQVYTCGLGLLPMLPFTDYSAVGDFLSGNTLGGCGFLLVNALLASLLPNLLFTVAFKFVDSGVVSILASGAEPTSALLCGLFVYGEIPTVFGVLGMVIVIISMIVLGRSDVDTEPHPEADTGADTG